MFTQHFFINTVLSLLVVHWKERFAHHLRGKEDKAIERRICCISGAVSLITCEPYQLFLAYEIVFV